MSDGYPFLWVASVRDCPDGVDIVCNDDFYAGMRDGCVRLVALGDVVSVNPLHVVHWVREIQIPAEINPMYLASTTPLVRQGTWTIVYDGRGVDRRTMAVWGPPRIAGNDRAVNVVVGDFPDTRNMWDIRARAHDPSDWVYPDAFVPMDRRNDVDAG